MACEHLVSAFNFKNIQLKHRVVMAPMTRTRNDPITEAPREINILYYTQRASEGGLIITEGTYPCPGGRGYIRQPGIVTKEQIDAWKLVNAAVHAKGGFMFCQLMHAGRISHSNLLPNGELPVAPSAIKAEGQVHVRTGKKVEYEVPRALETEEIPMVINEIAESAKRAMEAGFDGIELHSGNGYLLQEFLAMATNTRSDKYGGSIENRCRFVLELVDACIEAIGAEHVGIKLQQGVTFSGLIEPEDDSLEQLKYLGPELEKRNLAYVCMSSLNYDPYYKFFKLEKPNFETNVFRFFREQYKGTLMINGGISPQQADEYVSEGTADMVCFAVAFIANANLPELIATGQELNNGGWTGSIWYGPNDPANDYKGYTDWPLTLAV